MGIFCWYKLVENQPPNLRQCCNPLHGSKGLSSCWIGGRSFERCCEAEGILRRKTTDASRNTSHFYHGLNSAWPFYFGQVQNYVRSLEDGDLSAFAPCSMKELHAAVSCWLHTHDATTFEVCCLTPDLTSTTVVLKRSVADVFRPCATPHAWRNVSRRFLCLAKSPHRKPTLGR